MNFILKTYIEIIYLNLQKKTKIVNMIYPKIKYDLSKNCNVFYFFHLNKLIVYFFHFIEEQHYERFLSRFRS